MSIFNSLQHGLLSFFKPKSQGSFEDVSKKKEERISQGLPVSVRKDRYEPTKVGGFLRETTHGLLNVPGRFAATARNTIENVPEVFKKPKEPILRGETIKQYSERTSPKLKQTAERSLNAGNYVGSYKPLSNESSMKSQVKDTVGLGLEAASYLPVVEGVKIASTGIKAGAKGLLKNIVPLAKEGFTQGLLQGAGSALQEDKSTKDVLKGALTSGVTNAIAAPILGTAFSGTGLLAKKAGSIVREGTDLYRSMSPAQRQAGFIKTPGEPSVPKYEGEKDLTTKVLKDLEGRSTVSKQYLMDATNRPELKQQERDVIRKALESEGTTVNVKDFASKVKSNLLPLSVKTL